MSRRDSFGSTAMSLAGLLERLDDDADVQARLSWLADLLFAGSDKRALTQDLEDILETYFAQLDRTCSRLRALDEHVSQTEDFVNIDLARGCTACVCSDARLTLSCCDAGLEAQHAD